MLNENKSTFNSIKDLGPEKFTDIILNSRLPLLIEFYGSECMVCDKLEPVLSELADEYHGKIIIYKLNGDLDTFLTLEMKISAYPTFLVYKNGKQIQKVVGAIGVRKIIDLIESII